MVRTTFNANIATQTALAESDKHLRKVQAEHQALSVNNKLLENSLRQSQETITDLNTRNQKLEQQLSQRGEKSDSLNKPLSEQ